MKTTTNTTTFNPGDLVMSLCSPQTSLSLPDKTIIKNKLVATTVGVVLKEADKKVWLSSSGLVYHVLFGDTEYMFYEGNLKKFIHPSLDNNCLSEYIKTTDDDERK